MRQVPQGQKKYALIGAGRVAKHFTHFLKAKGFDVLNWSRCNNPQFNSLKITDSQSAEERLDILAEQTSHILLAINDDAIQFFADKYSHDHSVIHFSGSFHCENSIGIHPLMTFGPELYENSFYDQIPFIIDQQITLSDILPGLNNPFFSIDASKKNLYHCLCSMSGNFTQLLLNNTMGKLQDEFNLPPEALALYLKQVINNSIDNPGNSLTGPLTRSDKGTINRHKMALKGSPELDLYEAFEKYYKLKSEL